MITVGHRRECPIVRQGDGTLLAEGARFSETIAHLAKSTFIPKGVYRFRAHTDANKQQEDCLAQGMGRLAEGENIRVADAFVVDVMLNANGMTYETLRPYAETIAFEGIPVSTINLERLLLTKQTLREKDVPDRIIIERALEVMRTLRKIADSG